jgi:hypothetical protein
MGVVAVPDIGLIVTQLGRQARDATSRTSTAFNKSLALAVGPVEDRKIAAFAMRWSKSLVSQGQTIAR